MVRLRFRPPNRKLARDLETERFILRSTGPIETLRLTAGWRRDPDLLWGLHRRREPMSLLEWIRRGPSPDNIERFAHAIVPKGTDNVVGVHMVMLTAGTDAYCHVGVHDRAWWGRDTIVEVRAKLLNHYFRHGIERFNATIRSTNPASIYIYRRLGYQVLGAQTWSKPGTTTGETEEALDMQMTRENWLAGPFAEQSDVA